MEGGEFIALAKLPQVPPLEAAQVFFAGLGPLAIQQLSGAPQVVLGESLERDVDFGGITVAARGGPRVLRGRRLVSRIHFGFQSTVAIGACLLGQHSSSLFGYDGAPVGLILLDEENRGNGE